MCWTLVSTLKAPCKPFQHTKEILRGMIGSHTDFAHMTSSYLDRQNSHLDFTVTLQSFEGFQYTLSSISGLPSFTFKQMCRALYLPIIAVSMSTFHSVPISISRNNKLGW